MTEPNPARPDDGLHAGLIGFEKFLNSPPDYEDQCRVRDYRHEAYRRWEKLLTSILAALPKVIPSTSRDGAEGAAEDQTLSAEWNNGCDFAMMQLCNFLCVDPDAVNWDAATETVDGDVRAVIGNILHAKFGEDWSPQTAPPKPAPDALRALEPFAKAAEAFDSWPGIKRQPDGANICTFFTASGKLADAATINHGHCRKARAALDALAAPAPSPDTLREINAASPNPCKQPWNCVWPACGVGPLGNCGKQGTTAPAPSPDGAGEPYDWKTIVDAIKHRLRVSNDNDYRSWREIERVVRTTVAAALVLRTDALSPSPAGAAEPAKRWYVGAQNDGLFIINAEPAPSNDYPWHDKPSGPTIALNVTELSLAKAQKVVDVMNGLASSPVKPDREQLAQAAAQRFFRTYIQPLTDRIECAVPSRKRRRKSAATDASTREDGK
jgi:hypothetical protein